MHPRRVILFLALTLFCCGPALAQQPGPQFWRKLTCEPLEPRTHLERLENLYETVMIKAFTRVTTVEVRGVRIDAVAMHDLRVNPPISKGIVISLREEDQRREDNRAFIDYDEIGLLLNAIDVVSRIDETVTRLPGFEARYKTKGDFEIVVFRQTQRGTAVLLTTGICDRARQTMTLDDLAKIKAMIQEAKTRLDEIR
ncbi:MAG TPA: hypothetical protein VK893_00750 [Pyrinomonadaceae bacterium]|nr:hypothetical protein [Pyrinomonadaceae bacterium]